MNDTYTTTVSGGEIDHIGPTNYYGSAPQSKSPDNAATVQELRKIQRELEEIADLCDELREAARKNNKSKIEEIIDKLSDGAFGAVGEILAGGVFKKIFKM